MADVKEIPPQMVLPVKLQELRVAAYCRVSTDHDEQDSSMELQEHYYRDLIDSNPNWENAGIFSEKATGLNIEERKAFQAMLRVCRKGKINLILTKSISRFGRNTLDMLKAIRELHNLGVDVYFEKENLWLHGQHLQILLTMYCAFAQREIEGMSRDIRWGVRQGFRSGRSGYAEFVCFGYKRGDNGKLAIDEPDAKIVRTIFEMRACGKNLGAISDWLHENSCLPYVDVFSLYPREDISRDYISIIHASMFARVVDNDYIGNWYNLIGNIPTFLLQYEIDVDWQRLHEIFYHFLSLSLIDYPDNSIHARPV